MVLKVQLWGWGCARPLTLSPCSLLFAPAPAPAPAQPSVQFLFVKQELEKGSILSSSSSWICWFSSSSHIWTRRYNSAGYGYAHSTVLSSVSASSSTFSSWALPFNNQTPLSGMEDVMMGYMFGRKKATEVTHLVWKHVVQKGDAVVDATCGNGHDTLAMLRMVSDKSCRGHVYSMDIQKVALDNTLSLLDGSLEPNEKQLVELFRTCHSKMEEVLPKGIAVRLVAFNLGYLPGGDKTIITGSETTLTALEAARKILTPGGLISIVVYVGHPGGREEYETVQAFASGLPVDDWSCCKFEMLNRPLAPILVFLFKR